MGWGRCLGACVCEGERRGEKGSEWDCGACVCVSGLPGGSSINAHREIVIRFAGLEFAGAVVGGHVPLAAHFCVSPNPTHATNEQTKELVLGIRY